MEYKILESDGVQIEHLDGGAFNHFASGGKDCILKGVLNECEFIPITSTTAQIKTGELLICGIRVKITSPYTYQTTAYASSVVEYLKARILVARGTVTFELVTSTSDSVQQDSLYDAGAAAGKSCIYECLFARVLIDSSGIQSCQVLLPIMYSGEDKLAVPPQTYYTPTVPVVQQGTLDQVNYTALAENPHSSTIPIRYPDGSLSGEFDPDGQYTSDSTLVNYKELMRQLSLILQPSFFGQTITTRTITPEEVGIFVVAGNTRVAYTSGSLRQITASLHFFIKEHGRILHIYSVNEDSSGIYKISFVEGSLSTNVVITASEQSARFIKLPMLMGN